MRYYDRGINLQYLVKSHGPKYSPWVHIQQLSFMRQTSHSDVPSLIENESPQLHSPDTSVISNLSSDLLNNNGGCSFFFGMSLSKNITRIEF